MNREAHTTQSSIVNRKSSIAVVLLAASALFAQQSPARKHFTYDQVFRTSPPGREGAQPEVPGITDRLPEITGWLDGEHYLELREDPSDRRRKVFAVRAQDGSARVHRNLEEIQKSLPSGFDPRNPAATSADQSAYAFQSGGGLYHYEIATRRLRRLTASPAREQNPRFSPDGKWLAYTREGNIFAYDLENSIEHQYTKDGSKDVYNGWASWVYFEEILGRASAYAAFWWAPDSTRLAFMRFDDTPVPVFPIYHADGQHGELETQRYPKAGDRNPYVSIAVVEVASGKLAWMDFDAKADQYIAWPFWTADSKRLTVQWMNRGQDTIRFYSCDPADGSKTQIFEERQSSWVSFFEDLRYFKNGDGFLLRSDVDGWDHLYHYGGDGKLKKRLTAGSWRVNSIVRVDEESGYIYFMGRPTRSWDAHLMRVRLDGSGLEQLTKGEGIHRAQVSPGGKYFVDSVSTVATPSVLNLHRSDGTLLRKLGDTRGTAFDEYSWGRAELFTIPSDGGYELPAYWVLPTDFDPSRQYPVVFSVYGGPDSATVRNSWLGLQPHYWAQRGVISISVDHRGSGHFGKKGVA